MPRLWEVYPGICLTTEEKARKNLSQGSRRMPVVILALWKHYLGLRYDTLIFCFRCLIIIQHMDRTFRQLTLFASLGWKRIEIASFRNIVLQLVFFQNLLWVQ